MKPSAWGTTELLTLGSSTVFVKRIPITEREIENQFSTRNLYDLPNCFNYGIGSFGKGIFRELLASVKCTNWVLSGEWPYFPLTYHYRIVPLAPDRGAADAEEAQRFVEYWGGDTNVARYLEDRLTARHELVLFQEYFPHTLDSWLSSNPKQTKGALASLFETVGFLKKKGVIHFDAHFQNVMTDGNHPFLTDFGLALDREYSLSEEEKRFYAKHTNYDYARLVSCLAFHLDDRYNAMPQAAQEGLKQQDGLPSDATARQAVRALVKRVEDLGDDLELDPAYLRVLVEHRDAYELMQAFSATLIESRERDIRFPNVKFRGMCRRRVSG